MKYISPSDAPAGGNMAISPLLKILKTSNAAQLYNHMDKGHTTILMFL